MTHGQDSDPTSSADSPVANEKEKPMAHQHNITVHGNLTAEPEIGSTEGGAVYARFVVAETPERFDRDAQEFVKEETLFWRVTAWRHLAKNIEASNLAKGERVIVSGTLHARKWTDDEGEERTSQQIDADDVGVSLRFGSLA